MNLFQVDKNINIIDNNKTSRCVKLLNFENIV